MCLVISYNKWRLMGCFFSWLSSWSLWVWLPCQEVSQSKYSFPYRWVAFFQVMIWGSMLLPSMALPSSRFSEQMRKMNYTSQKSHTGTNEDHFSSHSTGKTIPVVIPECQGAGKCSLIMQRPPNQGLLHTIKREHTFWRKSSQYISITHSHQILNQKRRNYVFPLHHSNCSKNTLMIKSIHV